MGRWRRLAVIILAAAFAALPSSAVGGYWRMWFNDDDIYLSDQRPIIEEEGVLYLPADAVLTRLGATYIYDSTSETYTIFKNDLILAFNMRTNQVITSDERFLQARVFYRNSVFYLPAEFVLRELEGEASWLESGSLRIVTGRQRLSDKEIAAVEASMTSYQPDEGDDDIYLLIRARPGGVGAHLAQLAARSATAAFFFTADDIAADPDALRQVYVAGHTIGLYTAGLSGSEAVAALERAQLLMERVIKTSTAIVLAPGGSPSFYREVAAAGFTVWDANLDTAVEESGVALSTLTGRIKWRTAAYFDGTAASARRLGRLIDGLSSMRSRVEAVGETVRPVRYN